MAIPSRAAAATLCLALCALPALAEGAAPDSLPCTLIYGQGRNHDPAAPGQDELWDRLNLVFNDAVYRSWNAGEMAAGPGVTMVVSVQATDRQANLDRLIEEAWRRGCTQVLETTLFADYRTGSLVARLRLHPLLGAAGPLAAQSRPRVGAPRFTVQREFALEQRVLEQLRPADLGREMAQEMLTAPSRQDVTR